MDTRNFTVQYSKRKARTEKDKTNQISGENSFSVSKLWPFFQILPFMLGNVTLSIENALQLENLNFLSLCSQINVRFVDFSANKLKSRLGTFCINLTGNKLNRNLVPFSISNASKFGINSSGII